MSDTSASLAAPSSLGCPLCGGGLSAVQVEAALHLVQCGARCLEESGAKVVVSPGAKAKEEEPREGDGEEEESKGDEEESKVLATPKRKRSAKKNEENEEDEGGEVELTPTNKKSRSSTSSSNRGSSPSSSPSTPARRSFASEEDYDAFLQTEKKGRFVRVGSWTGMSKGILHRCNDPECAREWKPSPTQALADDYYCPSCVLHHRNNEDRFADPRLEWTRHVPNTLYVFSITDPKKKKKLIKFGRTQHLDAWKRYPAKERKDYKMELLLSLRGKLEVTTKIENWWKSQAEEHNYFVRFSDSNFHGKDECLELSPEVLEEMLARSKEMLTAEW